MVVDGRREDAAGELVDQRREAPGYVDVAELAAHDVGVLALHQGVVVGVPGAGLGELGVQLGEQPGDLAVDVLGAGASLRDALSAWKPMTAKGKRSRSPSSTGSRKRSEIAAAAPMNSYWEDSPAVLIHGPRQCGKTTLALEAGRTAGYDTISFDDERPIAVPALR